MPASCSTSSVLATLKPMATHRSIGHRCCYVPLSSSAKSRLCVESKRVVGIIADRTFVIGPSSSELRSCAPDHEKLSRSKMKSPTTFKLSDFQKKHLICVSNPKQSDILLLVEVEL